MTSDWTITSVKVWDVRDQGAAEIANLPGDAGESDCGAALAPDGQSVWVPEGDGRVARYDVATGRRLQQAAAPTERGSESIRAPLRSAPTGDCWPQWPWICRSRSGTRGPARSPSSSGRDVTDSVPAVDWDGAGERLAVAATPDGGEVDPRSRVLIVSRTGAEVGTDLW